MAAPTPVMSFLRPRALPKPATVRHFLRFSTSTKCRAEAVATAAEDPNLAASRTAPATYPPHSMKSLPRPKESRASHRAALPPKQRPYPTRQPSHTPATTARIIPEPIEPLPEAMSAPNLPYFVTRTGGRELPVYTDRKRGGNLHQTIVRKIDGRREVLRDELRMALGLEDKNCIINGLNGHIIVKGHLKKEIVNFLRERRF